MRESLTRKISLLIIIFNSTIGLVEVVTGNLFQSSYIKYLFMAIGYIFILILLIDRRNVRVKTKIEKKINIFVLLMIIDYLFLFRLKGKFSIEEIIANFFVYLFYWVFIDLVFIKSGKISKEMKEKFHKNICRCVYICALIAYGYATLYMIENGISNFIKYNTFFRVSSYFSSGYAFGMFISIVISISYSKILFSNTKKIIDYFMFGLSIIFLYVTFTRNVYLISVLIVVILTFIKLSEKKKIFFKIIKVSPYILFGVTLILILSNFSTDITTFVSSNIYNLTSVNMRMSEWTNIINKYVINNSILNIIFGSGVLQTAKSKLIIDCSFLGIYAYQGLFMLIIFIGLYKSVWSWLCKNLKNMNYYEKSYMAIFSVFLIGSLFNNYMYGNYYFILGLFIVIKYISSDKSKEAKSS